MRLVSESSAVAPDPTLNADLVDFGIRRYRARFYIKHFELFRGSCDGVGDIRSTKLHEENTK